MTTQTDRIEKRVTLRAPLPKVWRAITNAQEFGTWFKVALQGEFVEGQTIHGQVTYPGYEHLKAEMQIVRMEVGVDYSSEPTTLVEMTLSEAAGGTQLTITESGFDALPAARRAEAFRLNEGGWTIQCDNIAQYVAST
jgi:uncharacterized protein YndB with AHSA1/START domain